MYLCMCVLIHVPVPTGGQVCAHMCVHIHIIVKVLSCR